MEKILLFIALGVINVIFTYYATKSGMFDDAKNFIKHKIFKSKM